VLEDIPIEGLEDPQPGTMNDFNAWARGIEVPRTNICVVVDDEPNIARIEAMIMQQVGYTVHVAHTGEQTLELVHKHRPDLVMLDFMMPSMNGLEVLQRIRETHPNTYVIIVTGKGSEEAAITLMKAGASDYIIKPLPKLPVVRQIVDRTLRLREAELKSQLYVQQLRELNSILEQRVREKTEELERQNLILQRMVVRDDLTGLFNQKALYARLEQELARSSRYSRRLGFIMLDLDFFKRINDQYGHQTGSDALKKVAQVILGSIRSVDWAARFGGDEFCVVLPETDAPGTKAVADRVRANIEGHAFHQGPPPIRLTASVGLSVYEPGLTTDTLVKRADIALYRAKAAGRNRVEPWR
jgi:diguanylate cyclase (GGDEF)-like protein